MDFYGQMVYNEAENNWKSACRKDVQKKLCKSKFRSSGLKNSVCGYLTFTFQVIFLTVLDSVELGLPGCG